MGWQQRAVLILVVAVILAAPASGGNASADQAVLSIQYVQVTNVTDRGFFVTWTTDQTVSNGSILYGTSPSSLISLISEAMGPRGDVHRVFVQPAAPPGSTVYFDVKSASTVDSNGGSHYRVALGQSLGTYPSPEIVAGKVLQSDGRTPAVGVLVTVWAIDYSGLDDVSAGATATSLPLSALTDVNGNWSLVLDARTIDGTAFFKYTTNGTDQVKYSVNGGALGQTSTTIFPLVLSSNGQVAAPAVSLVGSNITATPTPTGTNRPILTSTPTATPTAALSLTTTAMATVAAVVTPTIESTVAAVTTPTTESISTPTPTIEEIPPQPADTDTPAPEPPGPLAFPTAVPTQVFRINFSPTASVAAKPDSSPTPGPVATAAPRLVLTEGPGAWPDRSTPTRTATPVPGSVTPGPGSAASNGGGSEPAAGRVPTDFARLLFVGAGLIVFGSVGVALGIIDARRSA